jgi:DNA-binding response OmpR family regulator
MARVVLAEDDREFRRLLADALRAWGWAVVEAATGSELAAVLFGADDPPDLVLTDVRMPGPSGLAVLRSLRAGDGGTPVILMTAFPDDAVRSEAAELGAALLEKPFRIDRLRRLVAGATART